MNFLFSKFKLCFVAFCCLYTVANILNNFFNCRSPTPFHRKQDELSSFDQQQKWSGDNQRRQYKALIVSEARSGSTFTGDLLQFAVDNTYYSYEPIGSSGSLKLSYYPEMMFKLFKCQFDFYPELFWFPAGFLYRNQLLIDVIGSDGLRNPYVLFNKTLHETLCRESQMILIKTIRATLKDYEYFLATKHDLDPFGNLNDLKVIFLVRDPRPVMNSRLKLIWCSEESICNDPEILCGRMNLNFEVLKKLRNTTDSVMLIRYEDLIQDVFNSTKRIMDFIGVEQISPDLKDWISSHTSKDWRKNPYSTFRDLEGIRKANWIHDLNEEMIIRTENVCTEVMYQLGYVKIYPHLYTSSNSDNQTINLLMDDYPLKSYSLL